MEQKTPKAEKLLIYLDTCILLDYITLKQGYLRCNKNRKFDISNIDPDKAEILISNINILELTEKLRDSKISQIAIEEGYSYFDLNKKRLETITLTEGDLEDIDTLIEANLFHQTQISSIIKQDFSSRDIDRIINICNKYSLFVIDIMHFLIADREGCNIFITSDNKLLEGLKNFYKDSSSNVEIQILRPQEFKNKYISKLTY